MVSFLAANIVSGSGKFVSSLALSTLGPIATYYTTSTPTHRPERRTLAYVRAVRPNPPNPPSLRACNEKEIQQLKQYSRIKPQQLSLTAEKTQTTTPVSLTQGDISKMTWSEGKRAPEMMKRGAAVVHGNTAYFRSALSSSVYSYQNILGNEQWSRLPVNPHRG